jgi:hypothetical protein
MRSYDNDSPSRVARGSTTSAERSTDRTLAHSSSCTDICRDNEHPRVPKAPCSRAAAAAAIPTLARPGLVQRFAAAQAALGWPLFGTTNSELVVALAAHPTAMASSSADRHEIAPATQAHQRLHDSGPLAKLFRQAQAVVQTHASPVGQMGRQVLTARCSDKGSSIASGTADGMVEGVADLLQERGERASALCTPRQSGFRSLQGRVADNGSTNAHASDTP